jgi:hypothetical protein
MKQLSGRMAAVGIAAALAAVFAGGAVEAVAAAPAVQISPMTGHLNGPFANRGVCDSARAWAVHQQYGSVSECWQAHSGDWWFLWDVP